MKKTKGFTLVELVIVIVIVGILSIVAVPIYRGYTRKAMASEGKALLGSVQTSQKIYYAEYGQFYGFAGAKNYDAVLDVDARANKYFTEYYVTAKAASGDEGNSYTATATGVSGAAGIIVQLMGSETGDTTTLETL